MKLLIKQRVFSWTDTFDVYDEMGETKYFVRAEFLSLGHRLHICDRDGNEIGLVKEKLFSLFSTFEVEAVGGIQGRIEKKLSFLRPRYEVEFNGWTVQGDSFGWNYQISANGYDVAHISKELLSWGDTYVIDVERPADELAALMLVLAIDAANCSKND